MQLDSGPTSVHGWDGMAQLQSHIISDLNYVRIFCFSGTDRVAILQRDNDEIRYNSISRGEECILKKFVLRKPVERCESLERDHCELEVRRP